ncbi:MAG: hypothetical protein F4X25_13220 [Chloroflexi bacterium]|nr:hypothetical protein [Chloroflexota bacterium]
MTRLPRSKRASVWLAAVLGIAILATVAAACTGGGEPAPAPLTASPSPTAEATPSPSPTATAPASPTATPSPTPSASATPTPTATATPTVAPPSTPTPIATPEPPLVAVSPAGEAVPRLATVRVAFRNPPALADGASLVRIDPPIGGSFAWADERTLLFQPDFPGWHRGQSYRLLVSASAAGLAEDFAHEFTIEGQLEVAYVIPGDGDREVPTEAQILVQFNRSVAALTVLQEGPAPQVLEFDPPLAGQGEWLNTSLYRFIPSDLRPSTQYRVRIPAGLTSAADGVLRSEYSWTFETFQPAVTRLRPGNGTYHVEPDGPFRVSFNQPMDRASVEAGVALLEDGGAAVPASFRWSDGDTVVSVVPDAPLSLSAAYRLLAPAGLRGAIGGATRLERVASFQTIDPPKLLYTTPEDGDTNVHWHHIRFVYNNPMDTGSFQGRVTISGIDPDNFYVYAYYREAGVNVWLDYSTTYTVRIAEGVRDRGGRTLPAYEFSFTTGPPPPPSRYVELAVPGSFLTWSADGPQRIYYRARHADEVRFQLFRLSDTEADLLLRRGWIDNWNRKFWPSSEPIREWTKEIAEELREHRRIFSTTLGDGEPLPTGDYFLAVSGHKIVFSIVDTSIVTKLSSAELLVWALDYETGEPLAGVEVRAAGRTAITDPDGLARFPSSSYDGRLVRISTDDRYGVASTRWDQGSSGWQLGVPTRNYWPGVLGHLYTDRPIYRSGETVHYRGVVRDEDDATYSIPGEEKRFTLRVRDARYNTVSTTTAVLNDLGTFEAEFVLPDDAATGTWRILLSDGNDDITATTFTVAEFRAPDFEIDVETALADYISGEAIDASLEARFFFGGAVQDAAVQWSAVSSPTRMYAPGYEGYSFREDDWYRWAYYSRPLRAQGDARTGPTGIARFDVPAALEASESTQLFTIRATAIDANGQAVAGSTTVTVHPAAYYAGVRPESYLGATGEQTRVHLVTVDVEGTAAPHRPLTVRIYEREWITTKEQSPEGRRSYRSEPLDTEIEVHAVTTNAAGEATIMFTPPESGAYRIVAESTDEQGRVARSARFLWVSGQQRAQWRVRNDDVIELIADREGYEVGDVAEVLVTAPFEDAIALVTIERGRVLSSEVRRFETNSEVLRIPIEDVHLPNVYVSVVLYRAPTADDPLPRYHLGYVELPVSTAPRVLDVRITPDRERAAPGETVRYEVQVTDWQGRGVAADVSVAIVDQAVLALADEVVRDGLGVFWYQRALGVRTASSLSVSVDRRNDAYSETEEGGKGGDGDGYGPSGAYVRSNFQNTALWLGQLRTDEQGKASFELRLPDNATTWRAQARAVSGSTQVGEGESELLVTQPLLLRPALPRFLRVGDHVMLRTLLRNGTDAPREVTVRIEANGVAIEGETTLFAQIDPGVSAVFEWPADVITHGASTVLFRAYATGGYRDAVELSLPVYLDVTPETTATGGVVTDSPAVEAVYLPDYVITEFGSLEISLQGSLIGALQDELAYFAPYRKDPWESSVRIASRVVAAVAVQRGTADGLSDSGARQLRADLTELVSRQRYDGGWSWCRNCRTSLMCSGWILIALGEALDAGYYVPAGVSSRATELISNHVHRRTDVEYPSDPNQHAFLMYALVDASNRDGEVASALALRQAGPMRAIVEQHRASLANWGRAYLMLGLLATGHDAGHVAVRALLNDLTADVIPSANGNHWEDGRIGGSMHNGSVRTTALVLRALTEIDPEHPLIEETVRWLALARTADRWKTSVGRAQGMASLGAYGALTGEIHGNYEYSVWIGTNGVLSGHFDVPARDYLDGTTIAISELQLGEVNRVQFERQYAAEGRMYYGLNLRYVTPAQGIEALNRGFAVSHRYSLLDEPDEAINSATIGDVVRVELTVIAPADRVFARVEDLLPAGLEPIDPRLKIVGDDLRQQLREDRASAREGDAPGYHAPWYGWYYSPWDQVDLRDDRLVLFAERLPKGVHTYVYYARATTPGDFFVAPAHAEEAFFPEVFGRSDSGRFTVRGRE